MILSPAGPDDAAAMSAIHARSFAEPWTAGDIETLLGGPGGFGLTVRAPDGSMRGFILARAVADEAEILTLAVEPAARRQGLARALVEAAAGAAEAAGAATLFLEVAADNPAAIALYSASGFEQAGLRRGYYRRPGADAIDALVLRRTLNRRAG